MDKINVTIEDKDNINVSLNDKTYVIKNTQIKNVVPKKEQQIVKYDDGYDALEKVVVEAIPDEYTIPSGTKEITENGNYDVTDYKNANVDVYVNTLTTKNITSNGTYVAKDDGYDGYSEVTVETSGADLNDYFNENFSSVDTTGVTTGGWRYAIKKIPDLSIPENVTSLKYFFAGYTAEEVPFIDTKNITDVSNMFRKAENIVTIYELNGENYNLLINMFGRSFFAEPLNNFLNFGGIKNLGMNYLTSVSANYSDYKLNLDTARNLTKDSLMNVINNLYDIASKGVQTQQLQIGSTNIAKLTAEEIAIATNKGWTVS